MISPQITAQTGNLSVQVSKDSVPVSYARIKIKNSEKGAICDSAGYAQILNLPFGSYVLQVNAVGFLPSEVTVQINQPENSISIHPELSTELDEVVVTGTMREISLSRSPVKIEVLSPQFFKINPVNSVIEALQTVNGVQEQVNCGVCGTNDIHINGMEGPYTLVLIDGMPIVSGLSSVYGFNGIPPSMIQRVEIVKGPSSTLFGTEAVGGVINIITKSPGTMPLADAEIYGNTHEEFRSDIALAPTLKNNIATSLSMNLYSNQLRMDFNEDNFTDIPLTKRLSLFNKWTFQNKSLYQVFSFAARYYTEERFGGEMNWDENLKGSDSVYGEFIGTERIEIIGSYRPQFLKGIRLDFSANHHTQNSWYGTVNYAANQTVLFSNLIWDKSFNRRHHLLTGLSNKWINYEDNSSSATDQQKYVPGIFAQHEFNIAEKLILLSGVRLDYHVNHGLIFSPRLSLKKDFGDFTSMRINYGSGFREVYLATEDHAFVSGSREIVILEKLNPERSQNVTLNFNHTHNFWGYGNFDVDFFYTYFQNKIVADYEQDPDLIVYENLEGFGVSRGISVALFHQFKKIPIQFRAGATWMDVYEIIQDDVLGKLKEEQLFVPAFSSTFAIGYEWKKAKLSINYTGKIMGPQHLPTFEAPFERDEISPWYSLQHVQITKRFKFPLEVFAGVKNILNYTQPSPLINPQNPYDPTFDTSYAFGPLQPRRYYFGIRYTIDKY